MTAVRGTGPELPAIDVHPTDMDPIDVRAVDGHPTEIAATDDASRAPGGRSARRARIVLLAAVLAATAVLAGAVIALGWRSRTVTTNRTITPPVGAAVDASGCPVGRRCAVSPNPENGLRAAVQDAFPDRDELSTTTVFDAATGTAFRTAMVLRLPDDVRVTVSAQCVPHGVPVPPRDGAVAGAVPVRGPADVIVVRPGDDAGCSVAAVAHVPAGAPVPVNALRTVVADSSVQLHQ